MSTAKKKDGVVFTPYDLGKFMAEGIIDRIGTKETIKIIEPSVGDGQLLKALIDLLIQHNVKSIYVTAFDINDIYINKCQSSFTELYPEIRFEFIKRDFLEYALKDSKNDFDIMIANPPYIRTQHLDKTIMNLANGELNLGGRVDLYQLFIKVTERVMKDDGVVGIVVSNKFLSNKTGVDLRKYLTDFSRPDEIVDFGDTKLFSAAVLPCVMFFNGVKQNTITTNFLSIYSTNDLTDDQNLDIFAALKNKSKYGYIGSQKFEIKQGILKVGLDYSWIISNEDTDSFISNVESNTVMKFMDAGKIRVGIKTTADNVFISDSWSELSDEVPELLYPLITHHISGQIKASRKPIYKVLYPYDFTCEKRKVVNIDEFPKTKKYLEKNSIQLKARKYVSESNKEWFEIWVPHTPSAWKKEKIVFRDISEKPNFWYDEGNDIVNGDCYWIDLNDNNHKDLIWLMLGIANSNFITQYYDMKFNNKLYSNRRRFMSQYVEQFPIPDINKNESKEIIRLTKEIYSCSNDFDNKMTQIDILVREVFNQRNH